MTMIKAVVRQGRLETEEPIDLPDGTELLIPLSSGAAGEEEGWDNSPEGIAAWLRWYDSLEPLILNARQEAEAAEWLKKCDRHSEQKGDKDIEELFQ